MGRTSRSATIFVPSALGTRLAHPMTGISTSVLLSGTHFL